MIDSHCHFDFAPFAEDPAHYLALAQQQGVTQLVVPAVGQRNWQTLEQLAAQFPNIYFALGLHPFFSAEHGETPLIALEHALQRAESNAQCVAVGECGLDFAIPDADRHQQQTWLEGQLALANRFDKPIILHCRKAFPELVRLLRQNPPKRGGVYHAFSGSYQQAVQLLDLGIKIGVGGTITYGRAHKTRTTMTKLPLAALLLETDAPDMPVAGFQGQPNRPDRLRNILHSLAALRTESEQEIARATSLTCAELFSIPL
ncbi:deoxyribonuclease [Photobacterium jeanii]|uniref:Deoxyribonuclease n=1 Tax=Photobacterium jeanii TaxID=858640 RepID=A0A178KAE4_9GAMM|nr:deoxyribonuclease [Photobacterium jeanii]PST89941.1 TatD family deoxyribonuclease [Photobacterium jeanii]